jgi:ATP-dependent helicase/nuclease subunit A
MTADFHPSDERTRDEIRTQLDANFCVEAGAGTGKTTVLVSRIVEVLRQGYARVEEVVVITFTEKAAAELASRVRRGLEEAVRDAATSGDERERLEAAIRGLNHAHIETIHAFAASLLRERPVEAGLDPGFEVLDDLPAQLAFRDAWDEWITRELAEEPPPAALLDVLNLGLRFELVREAADRLNRHRFALPLHPFDVEDLDLAGLLDKLGEAADELRALDDRVGFFADQAREAMPEYIATVDALLALGAEGEALPRALASLSLPSFSKGNQNNWPTKQDCRDAKAALEIIKSGIGETVDSMRANATGALVLWLEGFVHAYERRRTRDGVADFDDLLIWARSLMRNSAEVRRYFQEKYRCVLVDEFQDTDPIQVEMIVRLCAADGGEEDWRSVELRPGALFVVGDPKQSIYRFRRADITMYDDVKREIFGGERAIVQNFRSAEPIIAWVNDVFGQLISEEKGLQPRYIPLEHFPAFEQGAVTVIHGSMDAPGISELRIAEAQALAGLLSREISAGTWTVRSDDGSQRRADWRDVAVLIPSRTELHLYEDAFARAQLPYRHEGGRTFFLRQEVRELIAVLRAIDDPSDGIATVAALRSSAFGCSDEELFLHKTSGGKFDYLTSKATDVAPVGHAFDTLRRFAASRHSKPLADLVRSVLDEMRLVEFAMLQPHGDQTAANLLKVIDQARAFAEAEGGGLRGFVRWLKDNMTRAADRRAGSGGDETDALISEDTDDVVRIITVHAAKGLEFPIVVLANMSGDRPDLTNVITTRGSSAGASLYMKLGKKADNFRTPGYDDADVREKEHREAEDKRLLYVAATRAQDRLVVPFFDKPSKSSSSKSELPPPLSSWLRSAGAEKGDAIEAETLPVAAADLPVWRGHVVAGEASDAEELRARREAWIADQLLLLAAAGAGLTVRTATSMKSDAEPPWSSDEQVRRGRAAEFGTAVHALLERIDLHAYDDLAQRARVIANEFGFADRVDEIERLARNAMASEVIGRARAAIEVTREVPFTVALPNDGAPAGFADGRIDLLLVEAGADGPGIAVVDFKTDAISEREVAEHTKQYREQALIYAWAAAAAAGLPVREVVFLYVRGPWEARVVVDAAFMDEANALMRAPAAANAG